MESQEVQVKEKEWNIPGYPAVLAAVKQCEEDILSGVSDEVIQQEAIQVSVVFTKNLRGCKLSIRSISNEVRADELAQYLCCEIGSGGGDAAKAGGFLSAFLFEEKRGDLNYAKYLYEAMLGYYERYQIIRARDYNIDVSQMKLYVKKKCRLGAAHLTDVVKAGTPVLVRTLEGDLECVSSEGLYIMIGIDGEVYPIEQEKFEKTYEICGGEAEYKSEYEPTVYNTLTGESYLLRETMQTCCARGTSNIYARQLECSMKIFTLWDEQKYLKGEKGDYLAVRTDDLHDIYMISEDIFLRSYEEG